MKPVKNIGVINLINVTLEGEAMGDFKFRITKIDKPTFFLRLGEIIIVNYDESRVYSEDKKQYVPLDLALKMGLDGERM